MLSGNSKLLRMASLKCENSKGYTKISKSTIKEIKLGAKSVRKAIQNKIRQTYSKR